jgi:transcriptional regulator NrdR family protein
MQCPKCDGDSRIRKTWPSCDSSIRQRECLKCGYRWTTVEVMQGTIQYVVKREQQRCI